MTKEVELQHGQPLLDLTIRVTAATEAHLLLVDHDRLLEASLLEKINPHEQGATWSASGAGEAAREPTGVAPGV